MTTEARLWVGGISGFVILGFCMSASFTFGLTVLFLSAVGGLAVAIPERAKKVVPRNHIEELLKETLHIDEIRRKHGDAVADELAERIQQARAMEVLR